MYHVKISLDIEAGIAIFKFVFRDEQEQNSHVNLNKSLERNKNPLLQLV